MQRSRWIFVFSALALMGTCEARAQTVFPIGPFVGTYFDNFNNVGPGGAGGHSSVDIFNGFATVLNTTVGGSIKIEFSSQLGSDLVVPRSPPLILGQLGISQWTFDSPVSQWGGYWENNSRFDDAVVQFFDVSNNLIGTQTAFTPHLAQTWNWNGWQSSIPISRVVITGNDVGFLNGFIWWEDFQVTVAAVPEPTALALAALASLAGVGAALHYKKSRRRKLDLEV